MATIELKVPDLGDFSDVEIIEVLVKPGDKLAVDDPVITLETDKAAMDVPATDPGTVKELKVEVGDKVSEGDLVLTLDTEDESDAADDGAPQRDEDLDATVVMDSAAKASALKSAGAADDSGAGDAPEPREDPEGDATHEAELVVIGSGPGGYTAAFRAADLGLDVILVERYESLGGVCLNVGCIPSKALLHAAKVIDEAAEMREHGIRFGDPQIDPGKLNGWKESVVGRLTDGISKLAKARKVRVVQGTAKFVSPHRLELDGGDTIAFSKCIIAAGSQSAELPGLPDDPRIVDSTGALEVDPLPKRLLVVGGGIIGLEMACVYSALGTEVSVVELMDQLMPGTDPDLVRPFQKIIKKRYECWVPG